ncbi:enoyl-CoA hydratase-related protein [Parahaliea mediterranea]|uniref:Enoyl-CoA hydratase/isomerase family protein n=1 Tax=Parahaliea mediterranea TaxID=651086 RepID=A0A939DFV7_9GAMM|nr:enoyl-CoA hydratase-related protein [Parahaliea mediterranea]MBN7797498.1 enoyl-CoA hydratase/isomerase family protein [Parahaliea mediterranea]
MSSDSVVSVDQRDAVLCITIDRESVKNALHPPASRELAGIFRQFEADSTLRVAIVTGAGGDAFCAGNDVKFAATASRDERRLPAEGFGGLTNFFNRTKPVIAAVNGFAMGGGFEIALAADIVVAGRHATFALPEPRLGIAAVGGGIQRLSRQIPYKLAVEMLVTGSRVSADRGYEMGFVNHVVESGQEMAKSLEIAREIIACAPLSVEVSLASARQVLAGIDLEAAMASDIEHARRLVKSSDAAEGVRAFTQKRKPQWSGS